MSRVLDVLLRGGEVKLSFDPSAQEIQAEAMGKVPGKRRRACIAKGDGAADVDEALDYLEFALKGKVSAR